MTNISHVSALFSRHCQAKVVVSRLPLFSVGRLNTIRIVKAEGLQRDGYDSFNPDYDWGHMSLLSLPAACRFCRQNATLYQSFAGAQFLLVACTCFMTTNWYKLWKDRSSAFISNIYRGPISSRTGQRGYRVCNLYSGDWPRGDGTVAARWTKPLL